MVCRESQRACIPSESMFLKKEVMNLRDSKGGGITWEDLEEDKRREEMMIQLYFNFKN